jgi:hybrid cluster-associated redox disulfide protein
MEAVNMSQITRDTVIADILDIAPESAPLFLSIGMHCLGCAMSSGETLGEACEVHGVDFDEFYEQLKEFVEE